MAEISKEEQFEEEQMDTPVEEILNTEIEYCHVRDELINLRQESIEYLRNAIC